MFDNSNDVSREVIYARPLFGDTLILSRPDLPLYDIDVFAPKPSTAKEREFRSLENRFRGIVCKHRKFIKLMKLPK